MWRFIESSADKDHKPKGPVESEYEYAMSPGACYSWTVNRIDKMAPMCTPPQQMHDSSGAHDSTPKWHVDQISKWGNSTRRVHTFTTRHWNRHSVVTASILSHCTVRASSGIRTRWRTHTYASDSYLDHRNGCRAIYLLYNCWKMIRSGICLSFCCKFFHGPVSSK